MGVYALDVFCFCYIPAVLVNSILFPPPPPHTHTHRKLEGPCRTAYIHLQRVAKERDHHYDVCEKTCLLHTIQMLLMKGCLYYTLIRPLYTHLGTHCSLTKSSLCFSLADAPGGSAGERLLQAAPPGTNLVPRVSLTWPGNQVTHTCTVDQSVAT